jgi:hypothetical protein
VLALFLGVSFASYCEANTNFYVDSQWTGPHSGTASQPFAALDTVGWSAINAALAGGDVTVYFSAREASLDTPMYYDTGGNHVQLPVDLTQKSSGATYLLTLDGKSFYNTNHSSPSWAANEGPNMCIVRTFNSQNIAHVKYSNITVHGFKIVATGGDKEVAICGDNWTVEDCDTSHASGATGGPGILLVPTADGAHQGSNSYAPRCSHVVIQRNTIHDTFGEAIYIGGGGSNIGESGSGYPSHDDVQVLNNIVYDPGTRGGQGDGVDIKGGITRCVIKGNNFYNQNTPAGIRAIVFQGQDTGATGINTLIDGNFVHDSTALADNAITGAGTWGYPEGIMICNNVICNISGQVENGSQKNPGGIGTVQAADQTQIYNNTIYNCPGNGIGATDIKLRNNIVLNTGSGSGFGNHQVSLHGTVDSDYNAFNQTWGYSPVDAHGVIVSDVNGTFMNVAGEDFHIKAGANIISAGVVIDFFNDDFDGLIRAFPWDIGGFKYVSGATPTPTPSPSPTPTATQTPTPTPSPTATPEPSSTPAATATPTSTPAQCSVPNFVGTPRLNLAQSIWTNAGFTTNVTTVGPMGHQITGQSLPAGYIGSCTTTTITITSQ